MSVGVSRAAGASAGEKPRAGSAGYYKARFFVQAVNGLIDKTDAELNLEGADPAAVLRDLDRIANRISAMRLKVVAAADRAHVAEETGLTGTGDWLAGESKIDGAKAAGQAELAQDLESGALEATKGAMDDGQLSPEKAKIIADTTKQLPEDLTDAERQKVERDLVRKAAKMSEKELRRECRRALRALERPESESREHEDGQLRSQEELARAKSKFWSFDQGDGTTRGGFVIPTFAAGLLGKVLQEMTAPRRQGCADGGMEEAVAGMGDSPTARSAEDGETFSGAAGGAASGGSGGAGGGTASGGASGGSVGAASGGSAGQQSGGGEKTDWSHLKGLAFASILEHLNLDQLSTKSAATVIVTIGEQDLREGIGSATTELGHDLSVSEARRLACTSGILPMVLSGESVPLDLGRSKRLFTESQRIALAARYRACAAIGCERPFAWSDLHHENWWRRDGGQTNLDNAIPLCHWHHQRIHDPVYESTVRTDAAGLKSVTYRKVKWGADVPPDWSADGGPASESGLGSGSGSGSDSGSCSDSESRPGSHSDLASKSDLASDSGRPEQGDLLSA